MSADLALLAELEPVAAKEVDRHLSTAKDWLPHEWVPWSKGRDFPGYYEGEAWEESQSPLDEVARTALVIGFLSSFFGCTLGAALGVASAP